MRTTHKLGTATLALALALGGAACESDDGGTDGATEESTVEDVVEETVDNADEVDPTGTVEPNTGDDVGDESPGEG